MTLQVEYLSVRQDGGYDWSEDLGTVNRGSLNVTQQAFLGACGAGSFIIWDPDGTAGHDGDGIKGLKTVRLWEDAEDIDNQIIGAWSMEGSSSRSTSRQQSGTTSAPSSS